LTFCLEKCADDCQLEAVAAFIIYKRHIYHIIIENAIPSNVSKWEVERKFKPSYFEIFLN